jgi:hypothetical protein
MGIGGLNPQDVVMVDQRGRDVAMFEVASRSRPGKSHTVALGEGAGTCTCEDYFYRVTKPALDGSPRKQFGCDHLDAAWPIWYEWSNGRKNRRGGGVTVTIKVDQDGNISAS